MKPKLSIVVAAFGNTCDIFLDALTNSINAIYPNIETLVIGKEIPSTDQDLISYLSNNYPWAKDSPGSLRNILWNQGLKIANSEWVLFLDADMLLLKDVDNYVAWCEENKSDFVFTWRDDLPRAGWRGNGRRSSPAARWS